MLDEYDVLTVFRRLALVPKTADNNNVTVTKTVVRDLLKMALADRFDEAWYLERYPDVAEALRKGVIQSGFDHYASAGVYEGRVPYAFPIDELDYLNRHRDVARSLTQGPYKTAAEHFYAVGFVEGRGFQIKPDDDTEPVSEQAEDKVESVAR